MTRSSSIVAASSVRSPSSCSKWCATGRDALAQAKSDFRVNRLILVSDGQPTEGVTDFSGLTSLVRDIRSLGVSVSSLGVGDDFNEQLMTAIAEVGAGGYGCMQDAAQLSQVFQKAARPATAVGGMDWSSPVEGGGEVSEPAVPWATAAAASAR